MLYGVVFFTVVVLSGLFSKISRLFLPIPNALGCLALGSALGMITTLAGCWLPSVANVAEGFINTLNFPHLFLDGMLSLLLFAGAMHWDVSGWRDTVLPIALLALFPVVVSVLITGCGMYFLLHWLGLPMAWSAALLVATVTAPTDPVVAITLLKTSGLPKRLFDILTGEALFNDGVAVVAMAVLAQVCTGGENHIWWSAVSLFCRLSVLGVALGGVLGYAMAFLCAKMKHRAGAIACTVVGVFGGYWLAGILGISGPLAMVVAGLVFGAKTRDAAPVNAPLRQVYRFWETADRWACRMLFTMIGLQFVPYGMLALHMVWYVVALAALCMASRWVGVGLPLVLLKKWLRPSPNTHTLLTWGGLRGGLPLALAMSLPAQLMGREAVAAVYGLVIVSVGFQFPLLRYFTRCGGSGRHLDKTP